MGFIDLKENLNHKKRISTTLTKRGLKADPEGDWEIHGTHRDMNYEVFVGWAYAPADPNSKCICESPNSKVMRADCQAHRQDFCVAIYPEAVYELDSIDKWQEVSPQDEISII